MNPSREEALFALALEKPAEQRAAFVDAECAGDPDLRQRLEVLLAAHEEPESLDGPNKWVRFDDEPAPAEQVGSQVGRYKLLEKLGVGGFGEVWAAEQTEPVRRRVALKVIKLGMDTRQVVARFEAERQALAMMDHPNIARVLDAGATETGRPYFVMDLVEGISITEYCEHKKLDFASRLDLFIKVCQAIQHAHQKGIIHRDIKPSNILVTLHDGVPVPKVIDFGIAKATEGRLTDNTAFTQLHQFIGTPAYMSPEQAEMSRLDTDTRSDIYSLGVLLYELLAGSTPFDSKELMASGLDAMRKTIREKEPVRPSTKLSQTLVAANVSSLKSSATGKPTTEEEVRADSRRLLGVKETITQLQGDLDWIVMKCLEKDRQRRYDTANGLAADLKRYLDNEPVLARPPSAAYRFQKAVRRNKLVFAAGTAVATALIVGLTFSVWQAVRATHAEKQAIEEKAQAQAALKFIQDDVLSQASPGFQPDRDLTVRTLLDQVTDRLDQESGRPPLVEASIRQTLGSVYTELGDYAKAVQHYERARQLQREHRGEDHPDTLRSLLGLAVARRWIGDIAQAEVLTGRGLEASRRALGAKNPLTLQFMQERAFNLIYSGAVPWADIEPLFRQALELHSEVLGPNDLATLRLIYSFGLGLSFNFQPKEGALLVEDGLRRSLSGLRKDHPQTPGLMTLLAHNYSYLNKLKEAEALLLPSLELRRKILGTSNSLTINSLTILARTYVQQGNFVEAEKLTEELKSLCRRVKIENGLFTQWNVSVLGWCYLEQGHFAEAGTVCELAVQAAERKPDGNPLANANTFINLGAVRLAQEQYADAENYLRKGLPFLEKYWAKEAYRPYVMSLLGASLSGQKRYDDAEPLLVQGYEGLVQRQASLPPYLNAPRRIEESIERLVQLYDAWGKPAQAAEWKQKLATFKQANKAAEKKPEQP